MDSGNNTTEMNDKIPQLTFDKAVLVQHLYCFCNADSWFLHQEEFNPFKPQIEKASTTLGNIETIGDLAEETICIPALNIENFIGLKASSTLKPAAGPAWADGGESDRLSTEKSAKALALRPDVMNKNIFRALRRQTKEMFEAFLAAHSLPNLKLKRVFKSNLTRFADSLLAGMNGDWRTQIKFTLSRFITYLGLFINYCVMKKELAQTEDFHKAIETNDLLYSYSHKKFRDYLAIPEVRLILRIVFDACHVSEFVNSHEALRANKEIYTKQVEKIKATVC